jgi:hypothetical protein
VIVGLDVVGVAGTPTTGTGVRTVGSDSATTLGVDPLDTSHEDPDGADGAEVDDELGAGAGVVAANVNGVLDADDVAPESVLGEDSDDA